MLTRTEISRRIPQKGTMCLLDAVLRWDPASIICTADSPTFAHPLARDGNVPTVVAAEYAAQATAMHGALLDGSDAPRAGMIVRLSGVTLSAKWISAEFGPLTVRADLLSRTESGCLYAFSVDGRSQNIAAGRITVAFTS
jgi:predicted hotdog family 3-hydroxylacyl-ACP dehydratase